MEGLLFYYIGVDIATTVRATRCRGHCMKNACMMRSFVGSRGAENRTPATTVVCVRVRASVYTGIPEKEYIYIYIYL